MALSNGVNIYSIKHIHNISRGK